MSLFAQRYKYGNVNQRAAQPTYTLILVFADSFMESTTTIMILPYNL